MVTFVEFFEDSKIKRRLEKDTSAKYNKHTDTVEELHICHSNALLSTLQ